MSNKESGRGQKLVPKSSINETGRSAVKMGWSRRTEKDMVEEVYKTKIQK